MQRSKLELSPQQLLLLHDANVWNTKRELVNMVSTWMAETLIELKSNHQAVFESLAPAASLNGKITRGENHNGFPYVLLDYPNHFTKDEIVAARNLVWFGNGFHCTLHVKGTLVDTVLRNLTGPPGRFNHVMLCASGNEWIHHVNTNDWQRIGNGSDELNERIKQQGWIKLGTELPLAQPERWTSGLVDVYETWCSVLAKTD